jgi:glycosyltransferase involved in cell wall biosynthesis
LSTLPASPIRALLDVTPVLAGDTGVARYAERLYEHLARSRDVDVRAFAVGRGPTPTFPARRIPIPLRTMHRAWEWFDRPAAETLGGRADVVHAIDIVPPPTRAPLVMTVHDVLAATRPDLYSPRHVRIGRAQLQAVARAAAVVTTCGSTADEVAAASGIDRARIVVAAPGHRQPGEAPSPVVVAPPYILAVGSITPRKGFQILAAAMARRTHAWPVVVVAGPDGWRADDVRRETVALGLGDRFRFLGRVSDDALEALYRHATLVCHPSIAEGFGIPCVEAMAFSVPVVAADIPSVREIGGGSIELVPPGDPVALAEVVDRVLSDDLRRAAMVQAALGRSRAFTWDRMASGVTDAYRLAVGV